MQLVCFHDELILNRELLLFIFCFYHQVFRLYLICFKSFYCRDDNKLVELEKKFNSANPELIQKIRFGKKEESEKLVAEVDEIGKQCKKVAKVRRYSR